MSSTGTCRSRSRTERTAGRVQDNQRFPLRGRGHIRSRPLGASFVDGRATAIGLAKRAKNNLQLDDGANDALLQSLTDRVYGHPLFRRYAFFCKGVPVTVSRYLPGMTYGSHVDTVFRDDIRTDLSFTLFLSAPQEYEGGELAEHGEMGQANVKLAAGALFLYPSVRPHRVVPVTRGERIAAIGFVQSYFRDAEKRDLLLDLQDSINGLKQAGNFDEALRIFGVQSKLEQMWHS